MRQRVDEAIKKRFDADIHETGDGARSVVGVERGEDQVTGQRRIDGDGGGFEVANFPDHHDVGRLAENGAQRGGKCEADLIIAPAPG